MFKYYKKKRKIAIYCQTCLQDIAFTIPEEVMEQEYPKYPFTFRYIHGKPPHSITLYIDANHDIRGYEFGDSIQLSDEIIDDVFKIRSLEINSESSLVLRTLFNTYTSVIDARVPDAEKLNFIVGKQLGNQFSTIFKGDSREHLIGELQKFWQKHEFGIIDDVHLEPGTINFKVYECFECSHLPTLGHPVCKLDEGFLTSLLEKKFNQRFVVREIECYATGKHYCEFNIDDVRQL